MRMLLLAIPILALSFGGALFAMEWLWPRGEKRPALAEVKPLPPATRTSYAVTPVAIALPAIRDALDAAAPRDLSGRRDNVFKELLSNAELGWSIARGPLAVTGRPEGLAVTAPLNGTSCASPFFASFAGIVQTIGSSFDGSVTPSPPRSKSAGSNCGHRIFDTSPERCAVSSRVRNRVAIR